MKRVWNTAYARLVDKYTIDQSGVSESTLMRAAAQRVAHIARPLLTDQMLLICFAGPGNNGGDALLTIELLGYPLELTRVFIFPHLHARSDGCERALASLKQKHPPLDILTYSPGALASYEQSPCVVIDGIYGLGYRPPLDDQIVSAAIDDIKSLRRARMIAVDLVSGIEADSFVASQESMKAHHSVSFGGLKPAQVVSPAREHSGRIDVVDVGFTEEALKAATKADPGLMFLIESQDVSTQPWRTLSQSAHKFDRGHTLVIGGSEGKLGAPVLSAIAALRAGCGWSSVSIPIELEPHFPPLPLELTFERFFCANQIDAYALKRFVLTRNVSAIVVGPGTTEQPLDSTGVEIFAELSHQNVKVIIDAAATKGILPLLKACKLRPNPENFLLTPHPGEWKKLPAQPPTHYRDLQGVLDTAKELGVTLIHKGATPLIFANDKVIVHNENSNALAKAGTGDIFAGLCAGYAKCFPAVSDCANQSFMALSWAVDILTQRRDAHSILPTDVLNAIGALD